METSLHSVTTVDNRIIFQKQTSAPSMASRRKPPPARNSGTPGGRQHIVASIDLHGYRKSEAISRLTEFLDQTTRRYHQRGPCWVEVITGSGAHSVDGPVLRPAVQVLLEQRQMTWQVKGSGNACLLVNAASGIVLYEPDQPRDSKVIVTDDCSSLPHLGSAGRWSSAMGMLKGSAATAEGGAEGIQQSTKALKKEFNKRRNEERAVERAMSMSKEEAVREKEEEEKVMKRVVSLSILDSKRELEDQESYQRAVELSKQELDAEKNAEAAVLRAMELSRKEHELYGKDAKYTDEELIRRAMEMSQREFQVSGLLQTLEMSRKEGYAISEDDEALLQVLEQSMLDF